MGPHLPGTRGFQPCVRLSCLKVYSNAACGVPTMCSPNANINSALLFKYVSIDNKLSDHCPVQIGFPGGRGGIGIENYV